MHKQLEDYLAQVARQLGSLPAQRRDDELKEMRVHLMSAVLANRELGQPEETAVKNALTEFGTPEEASANVLWVWRRQGWKQSKKTFTRMAAPYSFLYVYMMLTSAHTLNERGVVFCYWAATVTVFALFVLIPPYLRTRTPSPLSPSV
jgi:uncharacterized membrane protein